MNAETRLDEADGHDSLLRNTIAALMDHGFDGYANLGANDLEVAAARERYAELQTLIDPVVFGAATVILAFPATRLHPNGDEGDALVVVTDVAVIICSTRRKALRTKVSTVVFPRMALHVRATEEFGEHAILMTADGHRLRIRLLEPNPTLEAALIERGDRRDA